MSQTMPSSFEAGAAPATTTLPRGVHLVFKPADDLSVHAVTRNAPEPQATPETSRGVHLS